MKRFLRTLARATFNSLPLRVVKRLIHGKLKTKTLRTYLRPGRELVFTSDHPLVNRIRLWIDKRYPIERDFIEYGCYDPQSLKLLNQLVQPGFTCMDIGANVGTISLPLARYAGTKGRVLAIEPGPMQLQRLRRNLDLNPVLAESIEVYEVAFSDRAQTLFWKEEETNPGNGAFNPSQGTKLELTTLDVFIRQRSILQLDFIKIDVEGMEFEVLVGGIEALKALRPLIYYESWIGKKPEWDKKQQMLERLLKELAYTLFSYNHRIDSLDEVTFPCFQQNTLAVPIVKVASVRALFKVGEPARQ